MVPGTDPILQRPGLGIYRYSLVKQASPPSAQQ